MNNLVVKTPIETDGTSPKVKVPAVALGVVGLVLLVLGSLVDGLGDTREVGLGLLLASPIGAALGFQARPGNVVVKES